MYKHKTKLFVIIGIIGLFSIGLVGFFMFSEPYGDGLEKTMEIAAISEGEPVYHAPLDYGDNYPLALSMGCIGLAISILCIYIVSSTLRRKSASRNN